MVYSPPSLKSKIGQNNPKTRRTQVLVQLLSDHVLYVTDGGKGIIKALRERFGKKLVHQRCTVHKDRNIQNHLAKKYREAAHRRFKNAIDCHHYQDAKAELLKLEE